jgi:hypothetical protein
MQPIDYWAQVQRYYDEGHERDDCAAKFGFSRVTWYRAIRRGHLKAALERQRALDWDAIQRFYDEGHTYRQCKERFGFAAASWSKAILRGDLIPRPRQPTLEVILQKSRSRCTIKRRLLMAGKLVNRCDFCGLTEWRGRPISIQVDHINGIRDDHRVENLRMLCPNCHSQTPTYGARNRKRIRITENLSRVV